MTEVDELDRLWDFADPAGSERRFRALLPHARTAHGGALLAELLTQVARAQGLQRRFDDAERTLDDAEAALRRDDTRGRIRVVLERGRVANTAARDDRGAAFFREAWELASATSEDGLAVDAAHMLGIVEPPESAREWNARAMELARTSSDPTARRWIGSLANNMGCARHEAGDDEGAIALFALSRDAFLEDGRADRARIARWSIARCLRSRGDIEAALEEQQTLLAELSALGETDGYVFEEIGECLLALGKPDEARPWLGRAFEQLSADPGLVESEPARLERLRGLAAR